MGLKPGGVSFLPENAFSFGFARGVSAAELEDGQTQVFVVPQADPASAAALAERFRQGFLGYGSQAGTRQGVDWIADRYLGSISGAGSDGSWVLGVRGAPDLDTALGAFKSLHEAVTGLPEDVVARARASVPAAQEAPESIDDQGYVEG
jgi:hypothetical protein